MDIGTAILEIKSLSRKDCGHVYTGDLQSLIRKIKKDHDLALALWQVDDRAAKQLAVRVCDPDKADEELLELWVNDLDEWGLTDAFAGHLVKYTPYALKKAYEWAEREPEFQRRCGFAIIAQLAWAQNDVSDDEFINFLPVIEKTANDDRFYVKKAVNWALRDIGKRNENLRIYAKKLAEKLQMSPDKTAKWVGKHRVKEFFSNR